MWVVVVCVECIVLVLGAFALSDLKERTLVSLCASAVTVLLSFGFALALEPTENRYLAGAASLLSPIVVLAWIAASGSWLHPTKKGAPDRRYKHNPFVYSFEEPVRHAAGTGIAGAFGAGLLGLLVAANVNFGPGTDGSSGRASESVSLDAGVDPQRAVAKRACFIRSAPDASSGSLGEVAEQESLEVVTRTGSWIRVKTGTKEGWVARSCVRLP